MATAAGSLSPGSPWGVLSLGPGDRVRLSCPSLAIEASEDIDAPRRGRRRRPGPRGRGRLVGRHRQGPASRGGSSPPRPRCGDRRRRRHGCRRHPPAPAPERAQPAGQGPTHGPGRMRRSGTGAPRSTGTGVTRTYPTSRTASRPTCTTSVRSTTTSPRPVSAMPLRTVRRADPAGHRLVGRPPRARLRTAGERSTGRGPAGAAWYHHLGVLAHRSRHVPARIEAPEPPATSAR